MTSCGIASALIGGMLYLMLTADRDILTKYKNTFDDEQKRIYSHISQMRRKVWTRGLIIGIALGLAAVYFIPVKNNSMRGCMFAAIVMLVNYFYYMLIPKEVHMVEYLRKEQIGVWNEARKTMQFKYHVGALVGLLGCYVFGRQF
jgi:hypothetical protein